MSGLGFRVQGLGVTVIRQEGPWEILCFPLLGSRGSCSVILFQGV